MATRTFLWVLLLTAVSGCATSEYHQQQLKTKKSQVVCLDEPVTGTRVLKERCYTQAQLDKIRAESKLWLRSGGRMGGILKVREKLPPR